MYAYVAGVTWVAQIWTYEWLIFVFARYFFSLQ